MSRFVSDLLSLAAPQFWRQQFARWRGRRFDRRLGVETGAIVPVAAMQDVAADIAAHAVQYEPSSLPKFERAMRAIAIDPARYAFIDYGSGKGRVLLLAARHPFRRIIGVEMSPAIHAVALANIGSCARSDRRYARIELVCADARRHAVPDGDLLAYFYNPFDGSVLREVRDRLLAAVRAASRSLIVVYVNPVHRDLFDGAPGLRCLYDDKAVAVYRLED